MNRPSLRTVPNNTEVCLQVWFIAMREKQILARAIEIEKKIGGSHTSFLEIIKQQ